jgi:hypothetical protein
VSVAAWVGERLAIPEFRVMLMMSVCGVGSDLWTLRPASQRVHVYMIAGASTKNED